MSEFVQWRTLECNGGFGLERPYGRENRALESPNQLRDNMNLRVLHVLVRFECREVIKAIKISCMSRFVGSNNLMVRLRMI